MDDEVVRVAVGLRLGLNLCEMHTCLCGAPRARRLMHVVRMALRARRALDVIRDTVFSTMLCGALCSGHKFHRLRNPLV